MTRTLISTGFLFMSLASLTASAQDKLSGYLCCNMHSDGQEISDANIDESGQHVIPLGTPIRMTSYGRHRVKVVVESTNQAIINDNSRDVSLPDFAKRYIVQDDPRVTLKSYPKNVQYAIAAGHLVKGMTREQVIMSLGYPIGSDNSNLGGKAWIYWLADRGIDEKAQFRVKFDENDRVIDVENMIDAKARLLTE